MQEIKRCRQVHGLDYCNLVVIKITNKSKTEIIQFQNGAEAGVQSVNVGGEDVKVVDTLNPRTNLRQQTELETPN